MTHNALAQAVCFQEHRWDAWGVWEAPGRFVPEQLQTYVCPTCNGLAEKFVVPERLA